MSDAKLQATKEFIQEKNYNVARSILEAMPQDAKAQAWLKQLEAKHPAKKQANNTLILLWCSLLSVIVIALLASTLLAGKQANDEAHARAVTETIVAATLTTEVEISSTQISIISTEYAPILAITSTWRVLEQTESARPLMATTEAIITEMAIINATATARAGG